MFRRTEDINSLKTRQIILQNPNGTFPANNQVLAISGTRGEVVKTSDLTLTSLTVSGDLTVMGDISANNVVTTITAGTGISVNGGATGAMSGAITITATGGTGSLPPGTNYSDYLYWNGTTWAVGSSSVHIGQNAGLTGQGQNAVAIGNSAGATGQQIAAVAIGTNAGQINQDIGAVAIGFFAGYTAQGKDAIAIGTAAGSTGQSGNSIIINATGVAVNGGATGACYIKPLRNVTAAGGTGAFAQLWYNASSGELCYGP